MPYSSSKITVLMSVYNSEKYLAEAVDSILNQTFKDFEFLIINDGSTDLSLAILELYAQKDSRIRVVNNDRNLGLIASLNKGLALASCDFIARMDADDVCMPDRLALQYEFMQHNPAVSVCGTAFRCYEFHDKVLEFPETHDEILIAFLFCCAIAHPTVMYRKNKILEAGGYHENDIYAEDYGLWVRLLASKQAVFANLSQPLLRYRVHPTEPRKDYKETQINTTNRLRQYLLESLGVKAEIETVSMLEHNGKYTSQQVNRLEALLNSLDNLFKSNRGYSYFATKKREKLIKIRKKMKVNNLSSAIKKLFNRMFSNYL